MRAKGFTLIELLVVISIISLLSSIVLSSINTAREKGRLAAGKRFSSTVYSVAGDYAMGVWRLNEGTGTVISDHTGNNNVGTLLNGPGAASWSVDAPWPTGNSVLLDGSNDYIQVSDAANLKYQGGDMTLAIWIKPAASETSGALLISKPWNGGGQYNYTLSYNSDRTIGIGLFGATSYSVSTSASAAASKWSFIVATFDSARNVNIYIDGAVKSTSVHAIVGWAPSSGDSSTPLAIGTLYPYGAGWIGNTGFSFDGNIDDPMIFTKVLTASEIAKLYAMGPVQAVAVR